MYTISRMRENVFEKERKFLKKTLKKGLTKAGRCDNLIELSPRGMVEDLSPKKDLRKSKKGLDKS